MTDFDSPWKEAIEEFFEPFLQLLFPNVHAEIDWSRRCEFLDKELQKITPFGESGKGVVDKLVKVWLPDGRESWLLLHIEVQSQVESDFTLRMFVYNYRIFDRYNQEVVSLAVLGDDRPSWRPDRYATDRWGCSMEFKFPSVKLLDYLPRADDLAASPNPMATVILAHLRALQSRSDPDRRRAWKWELIRTLYERGMGKEEVRRRYRLIDWFMQLPKDLELKLREDLTRFEEEKHMPYVTSIERFAREEGLEKGLEKGLEQGLEQGRVEGLLLGIESAIRSRFNRDGLNLMAEIRSIQDAARLARILQDIPDVANVEELQRKIATRQE